MNLAASEDVTSKLGHGKGRKWRSHPGPQPSSRSSASEWPGLQEHLCVILHAVLVGRWGETLSSLLASTHSPNNNPDHLGRCQTAPRRLKCPHCKSRPAQRSTGHFGAGITWAQGPAQLSSSPSQVSACQHPLRAGGLLTTLWIATRGRNGW